jgi:hypothetical protein
VQDDYFEDWEREVIFYIERYHSVVGNNPPDSEILEYLNLSLGFKDITQEKLEVLKGNKLFKASCDSRGLVVRQRAALTDRQMAAASVMLNLIDRRSDEKKLRDIGVSSEEYATWMQDNLFAQYMIERSEKMIANATHEAHIGLMRGVRQGNTNSIKLYYEMTGRYNPNEENQVNVRLLVSRILEAIQRRVRDPEVLNELAMDLTQLAVEATSSPVARKELR